MRLPNSLAHRRHVEAAVFLDVLEGLSVRCHLELLLLHLLLVLQELITACRVKHLPVLATHLPLVDRGQVLVLRLLLARVAVHHRLHLLRWRSLVVSLGQRQF